MFISFAYTSAILFTYLPQANETAVKRSRDVGRRGCHSIHCLRLAGVRDLFLPIYVNDSSESAPFCDSLSRVKGRSGSALWNPDCLVVFLSLSAYAVAGWR